MRPTPPRRAYPAPASRNVSGTNPEPYRSDDPGEGSFTITAGILKKTAYWVRARYRGNSDGCRFPWSNWVPVDTSDLVGDGTPPATPTNLALSPGYTFLTATWDNPTDDDFDGCEIWVHTADNVSNARLAAVTVDSATTASLAGLASDTEYFVWIRAFDEDGNYSNFSASESETTLETSTQLANGIITSDMLAELAVLEEKIANLAITETKIADAAITAQKVAAGAITEIKIDTAAITQAKIAAGAITEVKIDDAAVTAAKIAAGAITEVKIDDDAITQAKIAAGAITEVKLDDEAVTGAKIAAGAITEVKIADNAIPRTKLSVSAKNLINSLVAETPATGITSAEGWTFQYGTFDLFDDPEVSNATVLSAHSVGSYGFARANTFQVDPTSAYQVMGKVKCAESDGARAVWVYFTDQDFNAIGTGLKYIDFSTRTVESTASDHIEAFAKFGAIPSYEDYKFFIVPEGVSGAMIPEGDANTAVIPENAARCTIVFANFTVAAYNGGIPGDATAYWYAPTCREIGLAEIHAQQLVDGTIDTVKIANDAITAPLIAANAVEAGKIAAGAVTAGKIAADAVTATAIAAGAIEAGHIGAGAITTNKLAAGAVTANEIAGNAVTTVKLAANAVTANKLAASSVTAGKIAAGAVTAGTIEAGAVDTNELAANAVTSAKIVAGAIQAGHIDSGAVTTGKLDALAVTADKIAANAIVAGKIAAGGVQAGNIAAGAVQAGNIEAGAVNTNELAANAVTSAKILAGSIQAGHIASGAVTTAKLDALAVTAEKIAAGAVVASKLVVTNLNNIIRNSALYNPVEGTEDTSLWTFETSVSVDTPSAGSGPTRSIRYDADGNTRAAIYGERFDCQPGQKFAISLIGNQNSYDGFLRFSIRGFDNAGAYVNGATFDIANADLPNGWGELATIIEAPSDSGIVSADLLIRFNGTTGVFQIGNPFLREATTGQLIVDGSIVAAHLSAGAVETDKLAANAVTTVKLDSLAVTTAKLAAGAVVADKIAANTIIASKLAISSLNNLIINSTLYDPVGDQTDSDGWNLGAGITVGTPSGGPKRSIDYDGTSGANRAKYERQFNCYPGQEFAFSALINQGGGYDGDVSVYVVGYDDSGAFVGENYVETPQADLPNGWGELDAIIAAPSDSTVTKGECHIRFHGASSGTCKVGLPALREATAGHLIVDGTIDANHLKSNAVTTDKLDAGAVTTNKLDANAVTAAKIDSNAVTTDKLDADAVTATKIDADAVRAYHIQAAAIKAGAIDAGAIDAEELFVNGVVITDVIAANAVTAPKVNTKGSNESIGTNYGNKLVCNNVQTDNKAEYAEIFANIDLTGHSNSAGDGWIYLRIRRNGSTQLIERTVPFIGMVATESRGASLDLFCVDEAPGNDPSYQIQAKRGGVLDGNSYFLSGSKIWVKAPKK